MKQATLYHIASGAVLGIVSGPDEADFSAYQTDIVGVFDGALDAAAQYVSGGTAVFRTDATFSAPASVEVGHTVTLTGLPNPCWLKIGGQFLEAAGGTISRTPPAGEYTVELAGQHRGIAKIIVKPAEQTALEADPRWQALQGATPQQIEDWLTANVTSLASARQVLKILLLAVRQLGA